MALAIAAAYVSGPPLARGENPPIFPAHPNQSLDRTCFQTGGAWSNEGNLRSDIAIVYGERQGVAEYAPDPQRAGA